MSHDLPAAPAERSEDRHDGPSGAQTTARRGQPDAGSPGEAALLAHVRLLARQAAEVHFRLRADQGMTDKLGDKHTTGWPTVRRLFDIEQAADFAGLPVQEIWYQIRAGRLKVYHLGDGRVRIDEADLLANIPPRELEW